MSRPDVPRYFRVSPRFWSDEKVMAWPEDWKLLSLYVLTSPHRHVEGIFVLPAPYICADLHWKPKKVESGLAFLIEQRFVSYDQMASVILIRNSLRYQMIENENQGMPVLRRIKDLPNNTLFGEFLHLAQQHCFRKGAPGEAQRFYTRLEKALEERFGRPFIEASVPLNLPSEPPTKPKTEPQSLPRLNGDGEAGSGICLSPNGGDEEWRKEQELRKRKPHLAEVGR